VAQAENVAHKLAFGDSAEEFHQQLVACQYAGRQMRCQPRRILYFYHPRRQVLATRSRPGCPSNVIGAMP